MVAVVTYIMAAYAGALSIFLALCALGGHLQGKRHQGPKSIEARLMQKIAVAVFFAASGVFLGIAVEMVQAAIGGDLR